MTPSVTVKREDVYRAAGEIVSAWRTRSARGRRSPPSSASPRSAGSSSRGRLAPRPRLDRGRDRRLRLRHRRRLRGQPHLRAPPRARRDRDPVRVRARRPLPTGEGDALREREPFRALGRRSRLRSSPGASHWVVYALSIGVAVAGTPFRPAQVAILPSLVDRPEELTAANVVASTIEGAGLLRSAPPSPASCSRCRRPPPCSGSSRSASGSRPSSSSGRSTGTEVDREDRASRGRGSFAQAMLAGATTIGRNGDLRVLVGLFTAQTLVAGASPSCSSSSRSSCSAPGTPASGGSTPPSASAG